jgi:hypothetical protein
MEEQESNIAKEQLLEQETKKLASQTGTTHKLLQAKNGGPTIFDRPTLSPRNKTKYYNLYSASGFSTPAIDYNNESQEMIDGELERRDMELEDKRSRFLLNQSKLDTDHKMVYEDFLSPSKYPSAPPQTPPQSPLRPKKLEDELKSPGDSVKKEINERFQKALEAKEKAKADREAAHQKFKDKRFVFQEPSASSSSSPSMPTQARASSVDSEIQYYRNKTELINLTKAELLKQVEFRRKALSKRSVEFDRQSTVAALRKKVDENKDLFITFTSSKGKK